MSEDKIDEIDEKLDKTEDYETIINLLYKKVDLLEEIIGKKNKAIEILNKMKQSIDKLRNRDGESMLMIEVCIQNIIAFYDECEKEKVEE